VVLTEPEARHAFPATGVPPILEPRDLEEASVGGLGVGVPHEVAELVVLGGAGVTEAAPGHADEVGAVDDVEVAVLSVPDLEVVEPDPGGAVQADAVHAVHVHGPRTLDTHVAQDDVGPFQVKAPHEGRAGKAEDGLVGGDLDAGGDPGTHGAGDIDDTGAAGGGFGLEGGKGGDGDGREIPATGGPPALGAPAGRGAKVRGKDG